MAGAYYNEFDAKAAAWLRQLIKAGLIADGDVDERSVTEVRAGDLRGYSQCHFFAGIGGWSYALRLAGWPDERSVWTGSCPCQPFSVAGRKRGFDDERHLWPVWRNLIAECSPAVVFGEQVASATEWLGLVRGDLEALGYAMGAMPLEAASAGAYHKRDRYWFVAAADDAERRADVAGRYNDDRPPPGWQQSDSDAAERGRGDVGNAARLGRGEGWTEPELRSRRATAASTSLPCSHMADPNGARSQGRRDVPQRACERAAGAHGVEWIIGHDGKARRIPEPGIRLLAHGVSARVAKLRGFGNAIDPRPAAAFIRAVM